MLWKVCRNDTLISTYTYDPNGNRIARVTPTSADSGAYDSQDRMLSYGNAQYIYSKNGELQKKVEGNDTTSYTYDYFGNLIKVQLPDGDKVDYIIDGQNRRIGKKLNGQIVNRWIYSGPLSPVAELDSVGNIIARFAGGYMIKDGNTYQLVRDHLGSVRLVLDVTNGTVMQKLEYDEYGNVIYDSNPDFQPFAYASGLYETQTKLVRFGFRDYSAETGRWAAKDPIGFGGRIGNLYAYVGSDPINKHDIDGMQHKYLSYNLTTETLLIKGYEDGYDVIYGDYPAVSGPHGDGSLPKGKYKGNNLRKRTKKGMVCPDQEEGWSLDIIPEFDTERSDLRIHPDGNVEGTEGCIGVKCNVSDEFYNELNDYFNEGNTEIILYVN